MYWHCVGRSQTRDHVCCNRVRPCDRVHGERVRVRPRRHTPALPRAPRARRDASVVLPPTRSPTHHSSSLSPRRRRFPETSPLVALAFVRNGAPPCHPSSSVSLSAQSENLRDRPSRPGPWTRCPPQPSHPVASSAEAGLPLPLAFPRPHLQRRGHGDGVDKLTIVNDVVPIIRLVLDLIVSNKYAPEHAVVPIHSPWAPS